MAYSTVVLVNADSAFMAHPRSRLEVQHAAFVTMLAHAAELVVGCRMLDTGVAKDVSGVMRITRGKSGKGEEKELLYFVGDSGVEVFDRGEVRG
jgi:elongator complex protein 6